MFRSVSMAELSPLIIESLENKGEVIFIVAGSSMKPLLRHRRDKVCLGSVPLSGLKKYDIPLYRRADGKYILHRIVAVKPEGYVLTGDNQYTWEFPVLPFQVIGVLKGFWRGGKYIPCDNFWYQAYCRIWVLGYPLRRVCFLGKRMIGKLVEKLGRRYSKSRHRQS